MFSVKDSEPKQPTKKRTIKLSNISVRESKFVDDEGDITNELLKALPNGIDTVDFKIVIDLGEE